MQVPHIKKRKFATEVFKTLILVLAIFTFVNVSSSRASVSGPSMEPNMWTGEYIMISRVHYMFGEPQYNDIVVFTPPGEDIKLVKRLIGLPGDVIEFRDQELYRNDEYVEEPYFINAPCTPARCPNTIWTLDDDEYFFMGDNRNYSRDSRNFGPVSRHDIIGRAIFRYFPLWELGGF